MAQESPEQNGLTKAEFATDFVAGLLGGSAGLVVGHPFDTVKVILQTSKTSTLPCSACVDMIMKQEGTRGFFKGMAYPLASVGFLNSMFFGFNTIAKTMIGGSDYNYKDVFMAGAIAGGIQAIPATPIELTKVKLQAQLDVSAGNKKVRFKGPWDCLRRTFRDFGLRGCFRGLTPTIIRDVSGFSIYIAVYKYICDVATPDKDLYPSFHTMLVAGGTAGVVSWIINFPTDTVKSVMQKDNLARPKYRSTLDVIVKTFRANGISVFYKGFGPALMRAFPLNAVTLCIYDYTQQELKMILRSDGGPIQGIKRAPTSLPTPTGLPEAQCQMQGGPTTSGGWA